MEGCRGSVRRREVNGEILSRILEGSQILCHLELECTLVESLEFYRTHARLGHRTKHITFRGATKTGMLCYLRTRAQRPIQPTGIFIVEEMTSVLLRKFHVTNSEFPFNEECIANDETYVVVTLLVHSRGSWGTLGYPEAIATGSVMAGECVVDVTPCRVVFRTQHVLETYNLHEERHEDCKPHTARSPRDENCLQGQNTSRELLAGGNTFSLPLDTGYRIISLE
jgi:hypothetical protein